MAEKTSTEQNMGIQSSPSGSVIIQNITSLPVAKQVSLVIAIAATLSLAVGIAIWSQSPTYTLLFGSMDAKDMTKVIKTLEQEDVSYKLDTKSGAILVPDGKVHSLRLKLAATGFPKQAPTGYQILDIKQGFGISQFKETTRYHRALEGELAKSVSSLNSVKSARVMLGLPKRSVFVRKQQESSASVVLALYPGRSLNDEQVNAIVYLVSASIPNMKPKSVTVVDQKGNLLTSTKQTGGLSVNLKQLDYVRQIENTLSNRIVQLLSPIVGGNHKIRAQVTAELDFTQQEQTRENYQPNPEAIRSEQKLKEINRNEGPRGIPGALTNQPPRAGLAPEEGYNSDKDPNLKNSKEKNTRNYELDRTISHIKNSVGSIIKLSVAVVIDDKVSTDKNGKRIKTAIAEDELKKYRKLVADTVGLDESRGDTLSIVNASFIYEQEKYIDPEIWEESWFWEIVKQSAAGLLILILVFVVIRPMLKDLGKREELSLEYPDDVAEEDSIEGTQEISKALEKMNKQVEEVAEEVKEDLKEYDELIEKVKAIVAAEPKLSSHIIKQWIN
jgi:flagellar M-ring protein FliF